MSMLARYRKKRDGFEQLLHLVETSNQKKKETFFRIIDQEDPAWGSLLRAKLLTLKRFFAWDKNAINATFNMVPSRLIAIAISDNPQFRERSLPLLTGLRKEEVEYELENGKFTEAQVDSAQATLIKKIRELIKAGHINLEAVDPGLVYRNEAA